MELDGNDTDYMDIGLPSPAGTPYRTPVFNRSQANSRIGTPSPYSAQSSSPELTPNGRVSPIHDPRLAQVQQMGEFSALDPRRFTPTLHANLVAEILALRREVESKDSFIETLENDLAAAKSEHENALDTAAIAQREARSAKRLLARAENDVTLEDIAKERDDALDTIEDLRRQVERLTKSRRGVEEDLERFRTAQERDVERWEEVRRGLERRAHIAENRLKAVLEEIAQANAMQQSDVEGSPKKRGSLRSSFRVRRESLKDGGHDSDNASIRTSSRMGSRGGFRPTSFLLTSDDEGRYPMFTGGGLSLADELNFNEEDEEDDDEGDITEHEAEKTGVGTLEYENVSSDPRVEDVHAEGHYESENGDESQDMLTPIPVEFLDADMQTSEPEVDHTPMIEERLHIETVRAKNIEIDELQQKLEEFESKFADLEAEKLLAEKDISVREAALETSRLSLKERESAIQEKIQSLEEQFKSLQESRATLKERESALEERKSALEGRENALEERENALEERENALAKAETDLATQSVKSPVRTTFPDVDEVASVRETGANQARKRVSVPPQPGPPPGPPPRTVATAGTQTEDVLPPPRPLFVETGTQTEKKGPPSPIIPQIIPRINIIPPPLTPPPVGAVPKTFKTASTQTRPPTYATSSMQTESIKIDHRKLGLSAPVRNVSVSKSAKSSGTRPSSVSNPPILPSDDVAPPSLPRRSSKRNKKSTVSPVNVPPTTPASETPSTPVTKEPLAEKLSPFFSRSNETEPNNDSGKRPQTPDRPRTFLSSTLDIDSEEDFADLSDGGYRTALTAPRPRRRTPPALPALSTGQSEKNIRKDALIVSGTRAHVQSSRMRSPSLTTNGTGSSGGQVGPPFPVPARFSSRKNIYAQERTESPTPMQGFSRPDPSRRALNRGPSLRKSRSATTLARSTRTLSPPPMSISSTVPDSPQLPPLPQDEVYPPSIRRNRSTRHRHKASTNTSNTANTGNASVASSAQQVSVVEAITQTMVGEWMWKYVRRRKSFGVPESPGWETGGDAGAGGQRHRRWVWLAPYERAVMWSSRQPKDGAALLGKSGRKLTIQSVLDVKDDTPPPKSSGNLSIEPGFNRSILILTPARALKFTAPNRERHYIWLTALSFLSHAGGADDMLAIPPPIPFEDPPQIQSARLPPPPVAAAPPPSFSKGLVPRNLTAPISHVRQDSEDAAIPPPIPKNPITRHGPNGIRDSIRVAKGKFANSRPRVPTMPSMPSMPDEFAGPSLRETSSTLSRTDSIPDGPSIPRYPGHMRKRSNTGSNLPPRSISHGYRDRPTPSSYAGSLVSDSYFPPQPGTGGIGLIGGNSSMTGTTSPWDVSRDQGTVRMEAFIETRTVSSRFDADSDWEYKRRSGYSSRRDSYYGGGSTQRSIYTDYDTEKEESLRGNDLFRGF